MEATTVDELRNSRNTANSVYMKFTECEEYFSDYAFCFFEGEDGKYYNSRIKRYFKDKTITYTVGNKKEVLKLMRKIEGDSLYNKVIKMFFIDNDFDESLNGISDNLYETPCYSIENFYAQEECFKDIIISEFGINPLQADYKKCVYDFKVRFGEFINEMEEFNALALLRRKKSDSNSDIKFGDIKTSHLCDISIEHVCKAEKYDNTINDIKSKLTFENAELERCISLLRQSQNEIYKYRGKNQLDFLCTILKELKNLNKQGGYFSEKYNCVKLNITDNRLSELSQYAITPQCLEVFLEKHSKLLAS